jgi:dipeptidyl aminopeptidase/acylaminoacyl peptidase
VRTMHPLLSSLCVLALAFPAASIQSQSSGSSGSSAGLQSGDLSKLRAVNEVEFSPDGRTVAYTVIMRDHPGRPYSQLWVMDVATRKSSRIGDDNSVAGSPGWSHDGRWLSFTGTDGKQGGLWVVHPDGSEATFLAPVTGSNSPLPGQGDNTSWSPDGKQIAFVSSSPGPETANATGDPVVITRYLYRPTASEGFTHFNDNKRLHISIVDVGTKQVRQLTTGTRDEHSIAWSPDGTEIAYVTNPDPNSDEFFHYDIFAIKVADGNVRRLTAMESTEYAPVWSPNGKWIAYAGTRRGITDRETTMEDTHVWIMDSKGEHRREVGGPLDSRQGHPRWSADGGAVYFTAQQRGSTHLARIAVSPTGVAGPAQIVVNDLGSVGGFSAGTEGRLAYALSTPSDLAELYVKTGVTPAHQATELNADVLKGKPIAEADSLTFVSNDNKYEIEAFLVKPLGLVEHPSDTGAATKYPLIVELHGGPHGQNGPAFSFQDQVYAAHGWATLHVNYRGSSGYGQKFADAVFGDQDGDEGQDVLYAVSAAARRNPWIDRERMGIEGVSYGGQLSDWLITQTNEFKAAVPIAGISNVISYNYIDYYNQYEEMEFGQFLHQGTAMDEAWKRSAIRYVAQVHTPTMLIHGENDPDVPIEEAEQYYIALKDVGVDVIFVRYPREGHGLAETAHVIDNINRKFRWYEQHFPRAGTEGVTNVQL